MAGKISGWVILAIVGVLIPSLSFGANASKTKSAVSTMNAQVVELQEDAPEIDLSKSDEQDLSDAKRQAAELKKQVNVYDAELARLRADKERREIKQRELDEQDAYIKQRQDSILAAAKKQSEEIIVETNIKTSQTLAMAEDVRADAKKQRQKAAELESQTYEQVGKEIQTHKEYTRAKENVRKVDPEVVVAEPLSLSLKGNTLEEIVTQMMPKGWKITIDFESPISQRLQKERMDWRTTDRRDVALRKLLGSFRETKLTYIYFWHFVDSEGNPAPEIVITDKKNIDY